MTIDEQSKIHSHSIYNKCDCFYCLKIFNPTEIKEWLIEDNGKETALCPYCEIDSVIAECNDYKITKELLKEMYDYWF